MEKEFLQALKLYFKGATGQSCSFEEGFDAEKILYISKKQGTYPFTLLALKENRDLRAFANNSIYQIVMNNSSRLVLFSAVLAEFEKEGIEYAILKGEALSYLYFVPELRVSGDIDILVSPSDEEKAFKILRKHNFKIQVRQSESNHSICIHEKIGVVELHVSLYYRLISDVWFYNEQIIKNPYRKILSSNGYYFYTLDITDGFIYTFCHSLKHFLSDGMGFRNLSDVLLYIKYHKDEIDFERVFSLLESLKYGKFLNHLMGIGLMHLDFKKEDFPEFEFNEDISNEILEEIFKWGLFGKNKETGKKFYENYTCLRFNGQKGENFSQYMEKNRRRGILKYASFKKENLKKRYPEYFEKKGKLPLVYFHHTGELIKKAFKRKDVIKQGIRYKITNDESFAERENIIRKLDMI